MNVRIFTTFLFVFLATNYVYAQKTYNNFNTGFLVGYNLGESNEAMLQLNLGHEWKPFPFLGAELEASYGFLAYDESWAELRDISHSSIRKNNHKNIICTYETLCSKLNGYLNIHYGEDDRPDGFLYASFSFGVAAIQTKGELKTFDDKYLKTTSKYNPDFYTGIELGIGATISNKFEIKLALGGNTIKFEEAIKELDSKKKDNFPLKFESIVIEPFVRTRFSYKLEYGEGR